MIPKYRWFSARKEFWMSNEIKKFHLGNFNCCAWAGTASDLLADVLSWAKSMRMRNMRHRKEGQSGSWRMF